TRSSPSPCRRDEANFGRRRLNTRLSRRSSSQHGTVQRDRPMSPTFTYALACRIQSVERRFVHDIRPSWRAVHHTMGLFRHVGKNTYLRPAVRSRIVLTLSVPKPAGNGRSVRLQKPWFAAATTLHFKAPVEEDEFGYSRCPLYI